MKTLIALNNLISESEAMVKMFKRQLQDHESGVNRLSRVIKASTETNLIENSEKLEYYYSMLNDLKEKITIDNEYLEELQNAIKRQQSFNLKKLRLKKFDEIQIPSDKKLEAMKIFDEFVLDEMIIQDDAFEIFIKTNLVEEEKLEDTRIKFLEIYNDFKSRLKNIKEEDISNMGFLDYKIVFVVFNLHILVEDIKEMMTPTPDIEEVIGENKDETIAGEQKEIQQPQTTFKGFPKFEDWWIDELWKNPEAYLALYKWKTIISKICITYEHKNIWKEIFQNWVFIKMLLNTKKERAFAYSFAFDSVMKKYGEIEEELDDSNIEALENIIHRIILKEDMVSVKKDHHLVTSYVEFKRKKLLG
ncbi:hypothetical protein [Arcobacter sp. FWKO B]|uniref:hypothetical protein n=1 Tax=Arcobacter sp. FWKO B TaxID=2593672 RepID=UPI0018A67522|nr:hypothetical protein [Arcobacter sp. FWKO B]QOG11198.1 hypothetical protein FWKOB_00190 [Arcobacter sp. FWKO B]